MSDTCVQCISKRVWGYDAPGTLQIHKVLKLRLNMHGNLENKIEHIWVGHAHMSDTRIQVQVT